MKLVHRFVSIVVVIGLLLSVAAAEEVRNPFGIPDIADPTGDDVLAHHDRAPLDGGDKDPNAEAWPEVPVEGDPMKFDGVWLGRWTSGAPTTWYGTSETRIAKRGERLYILQGSWYIEALRQRDGRYAGRWVSAGSATGGGTWVGRIVNDERIDGDWASGRWDFRRRFQ